MRLYSTVIRPKPSFIITALSEVSWMRLWQITLSTLFMAKTWIAPQRFLMAPLWWMWLLRITLPVKHGYSRVRSATTSRSIQVTVFCFELLATDTPHAPG